jgi:hypothetical protein
MKLTSGFAGLVPQVFDLFHRKTCVFGQKECPALVHPTDVLFH